MSENPQVAWSAYWSTQNVGAQACLPHAPLAAQALIEDCWRAFFSTVPESVEVLDLGCGAGAVARFGLRLRPDLRFTGADYADTLPPDQPGLTFHPRIRLEALPFDDGQFPAITSQFALEYANRDPALAELARVLAPRGQACIVAHHSDSRIVAHNRSRALVLQAIARLFDEGLARPELSVQIAALQTQHAGQAVISEIATAVRRGADIALLRTRMAGELARLAALGAAALDRNAANQLTAAAEALGLAVHQQALSLPEEPTLAWCYTIQR